MLHRASNDPITAPPAFLESAGETDVRAAASQLRRMAAALDEHADASASERASTQAALRQGQKLAALGALTSGVAHDFNNLLHVMDGALQKLSPTVAGNPAAERQVANAMAAARRCGQLAGQLLAFGRRPDAAPDALNLAETLDDMGDLLRQAVGEAVSIDVEAPSNLWRAHADPAQFENAVLNLAINARDAMSGSGRLVLRLANAPAQAPDLEHRVRLSVIDTGCGMTPDTALRAADPFFSTKPPGEGTGLGLAMVERFARASGGSLRIHSAPGRGATIEIDLPCAPGATEVRENGLTVFLAKANTTERVQMAEGLKERGYKVLHAPSAREALPVLEIGRRIDLIVLDEAMSGQVCGRRLLRRARDRWPGLGVLISAPGQDPRDLAQWIDAPPRLAADVEILRGPCTPERLDLRLREIHAKARRAKPVLIVGAQTPPHRADA